MTHRRFWIGVFALGAAFSFSVSPAAKAQETGTLSLANNKLDDLLNTDLEHLMTLQITSVSKRSEALIDAPAAVSVMTSDDIAHSGMRTIPDLLRLSPGLDVAQVNAHQWAISSRGFNDRFANKLLVLMDGRTVYDPFFSGVYWDMQDYILPDLDRIEVIRGPGASLYGANAVNGVINITSKDSSETQGTRVDTGYGNTEQSASARYGGKIGQDATYRVYEKYANYTSTPATDGSNFDGYNSKQVGFRSDWHESKDDKVTFQGDVIANQGGMRENVPFDPLGGASGSFPATPAGVVNYAPGRNDYTPTTDGYHNSNANILGRWTHHIESDNTTTAQIYWNRTDREEIAYHEKADTYDFDFHHNLDMGDAHKVVWGTGMRVISDDIAGSPILSLNQAKRTTYTYSGFVQDTVTLIPDTLFLTPGLKVEDNYYTGFEIEPSGRLSWTPTDTQTVWTSVSKSIRTPNRAENDVRFNVRDYISPVGGGVYVPGKIMLMPNPNLDAESVLSYEVGYRIKPTNRLSFDTAGYINQYRHMTVYGSAVASPGVPVLQNVTQSSADLAGTTFGAEESVNWQTTDQWRLTGSYSWLEMQTHKVSLNQHSPEHQFQIRSLYNPLPQIDLDGSLFWVNQIEIANTSINDAAGGGINTKVPSYFRADLRAAWRATDQVEVSVTGENLIQSRHLEFGSSAFGESASYVPRSVYGAVTVKF